MEISVVFRVHPAEIVEASKVVDSDHVVPSLVMSLSMLRLLFSGNQFAEGTADLLAADASENRGHGDRDCLDQQLRSSWCTQSKDKLDQLGKEQCGDRGADDRSLAAGQWRTTDDYEIGRAHV